MPIFNHFDILAPIYDLVFPPPEDSKLFDVIASTSQSRLLDAGGGTGRVAQRLVAFGHDVIVLDSSLEMLNQTKDKAGIQAVGSETECIPFPDESFTRVVMVDALHHVADQQRTLAEL
ncbi:MAG: methyltransferase domain-containing protein [Anaerolineales bacterium]|nr:methyltransferase domain-containing protein [Anaerolineales bacterium]